MAAVAPWRPWRRTMLLAPVSLAALLLLYTLAGRRPAAKVLHHGADPDVTSASRLHGRVKKQGTIAVLDQILAAVGDRDPANSAEVGKVRQRLYYPAEWRQGGEEVDQPLRYCPLSVSHKYKIIFLKNAKVGGTSVMSFFTSCIDLQKGLPTNDYCLAVDDIFNATKARHLRDNWHDYFVFTFLRNPLDRTISQYRYINSFVTDDCKVPWEEFCSNPYSIGHVVHANKTCISPTAPPIATAATHHYVHVEPQSNCLLTTDGGLALDFVGRVEHLEEDFKELIRLLNARPGVPRLPEKLFEVRNVFRKDKCKLEAAAAGKAKQQAGGSKAGQVLELCEKEDYFRGPYAQCLPRIKAFLAEDFQLLV